MLNAYLYQVTHSFFKKKVNVIITIGAVLMMALMIFATGVMSADTHPDRDIGLISGGMSLVMLLMFDLAIMALSSGILLYTNPDVNFYFGGPFSKKFNLIIPIVGSIKSAGLIMFVLSCQAAMFSSFFGLGSLDMIIMLLGVFFINTIGNIIAQILNAWLHDKKKVRTAVEVAIFAFHILLIGYSVYVLSQEAGSIAAIPSLGVAKIISTVGNSIFLRLIPVGGWFTFILDGIYAGSMIKLLIGILLTIASLALICIILNVANFDYYEEAIAAAQKMADRIAAKSAGVEDVATVNLDKISDKDRQSNIKMGSGASVFFYKHLIENVRLTKVFFINKQVVLFKALSLIYALFMTRVSSVENTSAFTIGMAIMMMGLLDLQIFAGGKAVLEYNRPYFYMIPEKTSRKLWYNILGTLPEIIFNAVLAVVVLCVVGWGSLNAHYLIIVALFTVAMDLLCLFISNIFVSIMPGVGKTGLLMLRQFAIIGVIGVAFVPGLVVMFLTDASVVAMLYTVVAVVALFVFITSLVAAKVIERKELV